MRSDAQHQNRIPRPNPLTSEQVQRLRGVRPAGPPPRLSTEPIRVQRRVSNTGVIMVAGQRLALGRLHQHRTLTVIVSDITLAIELGDGDVKVVRRTTSRPVRSIKGQRPRVVTMSWRCSCYPDESPCVRQSSTGSGVARAR